MESVVSYVVHKHTLYLDANETMTVLLPFDAELLCARNQRENLCVWYRCNPTVVAKSTFRFYVVGTGQPDCPSPLADAKYLDTALLCDGDLVLHVFYRKLG